MGSAVGDVATLAIRTGLIMAARQQWEPLLILMQDCPPALAVVFTAVFAAFFVLLPALALANAPMLYRVFSVPGLSFNWVFNLRFLMLFGAAAVVESFGQSASTALLVMRQMGPFHLPWFRTYCLSLAFVAAVPMVIMAVVLRRFPSYAVVMVKAFACCSLPATLLQCWAMAEVDRAHHLSFDLDVLIFLSQSLGSVAIYTAAVAVLATVGSRWRFVSYTCAVGFFSSIARASSFCLMDWATGSQRVLQGEFEGLPGELAHRLLPLVLPASLGALLLRLLAFLFFEREATGMLRTWRHRSLTRLASAKGVVILEDPSTGLQPFVSEHEPDEETSPLSASTSVQPECEWCNVSVGPEGEVSLAQPKTKVRHSVLERLFRTSARSVA